MKYKILEAQTPKKLEEMVAQDLAAGWLCQGGVAIAVASSDIAQGINEEWSYAQAMCYHETKVAM